MALKLFARKQNGQARGLALRRERSSRDAYQAAEPTPLDQDPLRRLLQMERYGFIARHHSQFGDHPQVEAIFQRAVEAVDERFALVPEGFVSLVQSTMDYPGCPETDVETGSFLLARHCVTNVQYQLFVDSGGYEDLDLWPQDIWPHLIDFKDQTGQAGPRFWRQGRHDQRLADHPVVGISFYEASAFARWAGYRLPTGAEWQMAASWRIRSAANVLRRYPWGDALDLARCNIWASGIGTTVPVSAYESGAAPNGVLQLIGNVWEWTSTDFEIRDESARTIVGAMLMKEIRGGAFDTYFASQATSCFRTALASLARVHNVGFRCVVDLSRDEPAAVERSDT